jgi:hypothetical protein
VIRIKANPTASFNILDVLLPFIENNGNRDSQTGWLLLVKKELVRHE